MKQTSVVRVLFAVLLAAAIAVPALAQDRDRDEEPETGTTSPRLPDMGGDRTMDEGAAAKLALRDLSTVIQAGPIDATKYIVGPGDVLEIDLWGPYSRNQLITVSPEGTVFLPGSGTIDVSGKTLAWTRQRLLRVMSETFRGVRADVRLVKLRTFKVFVSGLVKHPGGVSVTSVTRASEALGHAQVEEGGSRRNVVIQRRDGSRVHVDLESFEMAGIQDADPTLVDGDVLIVSRATRFVGASGAVGRIGEHELSDGDSLATLVRLAHGLLPSAVGDHALLVRFTTDTHRESLWVNVQDPASPDRRLPLGNGDRLFVQFKPDYHVLPTVGIFGEVGRPGSYPIVLGRDRFSDLITWAEGFRPLANRAGIHLLRETASGADRDPEFERLVRLSRSEMTESEYAKFQTKLAERKNSFRLDWSQIQQGKAESDPLLQANDVVRVEQLVPTVRVEGEVRRPGFVDYVSGRSLREYVDLSGGFTDNAARSKIRVSRGVTGQVLPARSLNNIQPGDFIWIPERRDVDAWAVFRDVVAVGGQIAVIIFTLSR